MRPVLATLTIFGFFLGLSGELSAGRVERKFVLTSHPAKLHQVVRLRGADQHTGMGILSVHIITTIHFTIRRYLSSRLICSRIM